MKIHKKFEIIYQVGMQKLGRSKDSEMEGEIFFKLEGDKKENPSRDTGSTRDLEKIPPFFQQMCYYLIERLIRL